MKWPRSRTPIPAIERLLEHGWSVMLYDGECVLCAGAVRFVARRSQHRLLAFAAMQSDAARNALAARGRTSTGFDTMLVLEDDRVLERSDATIRLAALMGAPWTGFAAALGLVPRPLRDAAYGAVARSRYRLLGRRQHCLLADSVSRRRFVL